MATKSGGLEYWKDYFRGTNSDIFEVIEYAILVAASDCPQEFRLRRDKIAERLFSCRLTRCYGCDRVELAVPEEEDDGLKGDFGGSVGVETMGSGAKESKVNSSTDDRGEMHQFSNYSYNEAEALTEEIEEKSLTVAEVLRIKDIFNNHEDESDGILYESLRRLELMQLSVETLQMTMIGKAVNGLRKHKSEQIRILALALVNEWKSMVEEWVGAADAVAGNCADAGGSPDSVNPSCGLPSPPLDEAAFLATQPTSMELSQFFDGLDEDGDFRNFGYEDDFEYGNKPTPEEYVPTRLPNRSFVDSDLEEDRHFMKKKELKSKQSKACCIDEGSRKPQKSGSGSKSSGDRAKLLPSLNSDNFQKKPSKLPLNSDEFQKKPSKPQSRSDQFEKKPSKPLSNSDKFQRKPSNSSRDNNDLSDEEALVRVKLEAAKRKLHEGYQQAQNAKKQRTIQVMELHDLPKQGLGHKSFHQKPGLQNRHHPFRRR